MLALLGDMSVTYLWARSERRGAAFECMDLTLAEDGICVFQEPQERGSVFLSPSQKSFHNLRMLLKNHPFLQKQIRESTNGTEFSPGGNFRGKSNFGAEKLSKKLLAPISSLRNF